MAMRKVFGTIVFPTDAPRVNAQLMRVELLDVSLLDAPSEVFAEVRQSDVLVYPLARIPFEIVAPAAAEGRSLSLRVHVDLSGDGEVSRGDLITTISYPVPRTGDCGPLELSVQAV